MGILSKLFGPKVDYKELVKNGAVIVDVRTPGEFAGGHIKGSKNLPLDNLKASVGQVPKDKVVITCCASGMRSAAGKSIFKSAGYEAYNGGGYASLQAKI